MSSKICIVSTLLLVSTLIRGFFPKGRGEVVVTCSPVKSLSAVELTDPGQVKKIRIHALLVLGMSSNGAIST